MDVAGDLTDQIGTLADKFAAVDPRLLVLAALLHVSNHVLRSVAWRTALVAAYPDRRVPLTGVTAAYASGVALNALVPARGGDAAKIALARAEIRGSTLTTIGATITVLLPFDLAAAAATLLLIGWTGQAPLSFDLDRAATGTWLGDHLMLSVGLAVVAAAGLVLAIRYLRPRVRDIWARIRQGGAIFRTPRRYLAGVAVPQAVAWACRIGVVMCLLAAFGLPASPAIAALVMVVAGMSTFVPLTPGGAGTQQVLLAYALSEAASGAAVVSFSIGMQAGVTAVNALLGVLAAMVAFRTLKPLAAVREGLQLARA